MFVKGDTAGRAEAGRKGAARSAEVRRRKRALREAAQALLWHGLTANEADAAEQLRAMGVDDPTGADAVMLAQFVRACAGDTDAARFVRDTASVPARRSTFERWPSSPPPIWISRRCQMPSSPSSPRQNRRLHCRSVAPTLHLPPRRCPQSLDAAGFSAPWGGSLRS